MTPDELTMLPRHERAAYITSEVCQWAKQEPTRFANLGIMLMDCEDNLLWQEVIDTSFGLPFRSFAQWLRHCTPGTDGEGVPPARSTAYAAISARRDLKDIPDDVYRSLSHGSIQKLREASTEVRAVPEVIEAATKGTRSLVAHVKKEYPDQHWESPAKIILNLTEGSKAEIQESIDMAINRGDASTKEEVISMWAIEYRQQCENHTADIPGKMATEVVQ